ncbi:MAG: acyl-CoA thioesterase [Chitinophagales bacterium]|nr:acyl-CoA thioesterase [Chitinophagales bacterium]
MEFKFKIPLSVRFSDFDSLGHVNNAVILSYFEEARIRYFEEVITGNKVNWSENGIILAKVIIDFRKPIKDYHNYFVFICCSRLGTKSFDFSYKIIQELNNDIQVMAEGITVMVCYNYKTAQTIEMPLGWKKKVELFEGKSLSA